MVPPSSLIRRIPPAAVVVFAIVVPAAVVGADTGLRYGDASELAVGFESSDDAPEALVLIENDSETPAELTFRLLLEDAGEAAETNIVVEPDPASVQPRTAEWITLTFTGDPPEGPLEGHLVVSGGNAGVASRPVSVSLDQRIIRVGPAEITIAGFGLPFGPPLILGIGTVLAALVVAPTARKSNWRHAFGKAKWTWESWASTFTVLGALLTTFTGGDLLPEDPQLLGTSQYAGLSVLFAAALIVTAFGFEATRGRGKTTRLGAFLIASFIMFAAAFGQLLTLVVLVGDSSAALKSGVLAMALLAIGLIAIVLMFVYGRRALAAAAVAGKPAANRAITQSADDQLPTWILP